MKLKKGIKLFAIAFIAGALNHIWCTNYTLGYGYAHRYLNNQYAALAASIAAHAGYVTPTPKITIQSAYDAVSTECREAGINPALCRSLLRVESASDPFAVSPVGALGLMQIMPANAHRCGLKHPQELFNPQTNIKCGVKLFKEDLIATNWHPEEALERYNGGPKCIGRKCKESIKHARKTLTRLAQDSDEPPLDNHTQEDKEELHKVLAMID